VMAMIETREVYAYRFTLPTGFSFYSLVADGYEQPCLSTRGAKKWPIATF